MKMYIVHASSTRDEESGTHTNAYALSEYAYTHAQRFSLVNVLKKDRNTASCAYSHRFISVIPKNDDVNGASILLYIGEQIRCEHFK